MIPSSRPERKPDIAVVRLPREVGRTFDYVVCANKAIDTEAVVANLAPAIGESTTIVIIQNGVGNEEPFRKAFPTCSIISCVVSSVHLLKDKT